MSFEDFCKEIKGLSDPAKMRKDLAEIELIKARERTNKARIDRAVRGKQ